MVGKRPTASSSKKVPDDSSSDDEEFVAVSAKNAKKPATVAKTHSRVFQVLPSRIYYGEPTQKQPQAIADLARVRTIAERKVVSIVPAQLSPFAQKISEAKNNNSPLFASQSIFRDVISNQPDAGKESFSDVQLVCGITKTVFNCHRVILASKSDTFQRMFANGSGFAEGKSGQVVIADVSAHVMEDLLRFIYCGYINEDLDAADAQVENEFLYAATKYNIEAFVDIIMLAFKHKLTAATACRYLLLSDFFSLKDLKMACFRMMTRSQLNRAVVVKSAEWKEVSAKADLFTEFMLFHVE